MESGENLGRRGPQLRTLAQEPQTHVEIVPDLQQGEAMTIEVADALRLPLADRSVDFVFGSPPYVDCRTYDDGTLPPGHKAHRGCVEWVEWMLLVTKEALRVSKGPVCWVAAGKTKDRNYWPAVEGLIWEWYRLGGECHQYRPCYWHRLGIPGSGGKDWFRADVEYVTCFKRPGPLPWSDNTAMGHPPKFGVGGALSYRTADGRRINQEKGRTDDPWGKKGRGNGIGGWRGGKRRCGTNRRANGEKKPVGYSLPKLANPGCLISTGVAGGGHIGDRLAHENEAPFPEKLAAYFIRSLCPPGGTVCDPFSGSGTTPKVAAVLGRRFVAFDIRTSQVELTRRRISAIPPSTNAVLVPADSPYGAHADRTAAKA
jgi:site-specific DNA-methyltransferase (adenine-specific)